MSDAAPIVVVAGNIGAGKSALLAPLGAQLGLDTYPERWDENPWFCAEQADAFASQLWFLVAAGAEHQRAVPRGGVLERSIHDCALVFAREQVPDTAATSLFQVYRELDTRLPDPQVVLLLRARIGTLLGRIRARGRPQEASVTESYLGRLDSLYGDLFAAWTRCPVVEINTDELDVRDHSVQLSVADLIREALP